jgi:hypothetical protein
MEDNLKGKMEDDLKKNGRRTQQEFKTTTKKWKRTLKK